MGAVASRAKAAAAAATETAAEKVEKARAVLDNALAAVALVESLNSLAGFVGVAATESHARQRRRQRSRFKVRSLAAEGAREEQEDPLFPKRAVTFASKRVETEWHAVAEQRTSLCPTPNEVVRGAQEEAERTCALAVEFLLLES